MRVFECTSEASWAIYSKPGETHFSCIQSSLPNLSINFTGLSLENLNGYIVCPFNVSDNPPIIISGEEIFLEHDNFYISDYPKNDIKNINTGALNINQSTKIEYLSYVQSIINSIHSGNLQKCVAARKNSISIDTKINWTKSLINARKKYPNTFCSLIWNFNYGLWLTASPELLLEITEQNLKTHSLAGTKKSNEHWSNKESIEQNYVTEFIIGELKKNQAKDIVVSPISEIQIGELTHLINKIECKIEQLNISKIISEFHPTPAMCGTPKTESFKKINQEEPYKRELFSGFQGPISNKSLSLYVTIRCAKATKIGYDLFAGAGITADSNPEKEWEETENKMNIIKSVLI